MLRTYSLALALLVALPLAQAQPTRIDQEAAVQQVTREIDASRQKLFIPGASLAIIKDDKVILLTGLGYRDLKDKKPVTPDTLFAIGSSTKAFTSMIMAMAADEGKVKFSDSPKKYLPYFRMFDPETDKNITISDILSHRSGLPRTDLIMLGNNLTSEDLIWNVTRAKPTAKLGEKFQYQNIMFVAAGMIEGTVYGSTWFDLVKQRIFEPLGMARTNTSVSQTLADPDHSLGYAGTPDFQELPMRSIAVAAPAGAINSSARDMSNWVRFLLRGGELDGKQLVTKQNFAELFKPRITVAGSTKYGYGWFLDDWHGHKVIQHGGNIDGFNAQVALMPDQNLGFVLLTNVSASALGNIAMDSVWKNLVGAPADADKIVKLESPDQEVGTYRLDVAKLDFVVTHEGDHLYVRPTGQPKMELLPLGGRKYKVAPPAPDKVYMSFAADKDNPKINAVTLEQAGQKFVLTSPKPYKADISVEELMAKNLAAMGGEENLRKVKSITYRYEYDLESQGLKSWGLVTKVAPNLSDEVSIFTAGGRRIGDDDTIFDGKRAVETTSFSPRLEYHGADLANVALTSELSQALNWRKLFPKVVITGVDKVAAQDVYVVEKTPALGAKVVDYISKSDFRLLKRVYGVQVTDEYRDYKIIEGIPIAMTIWRNTLENGKGTMTLSDVQVNGPVDRALLHIRPEPN